MPSIWGPLTPESGASGFSVTVIEVAGEPAVDGGRVSDLPTMSASACGPCSAVNTWTTEAAPATSGTVTDAEVGGSVAARYSRRYHHVAIRLIGSADPVIDRHRTSRQQPGHGESGHGGEYQGPPGAQALRQGHRTTAVARAPVSCG